MCQSLPLCVTGLSCALQDDPPGSLAAADSLAPGPGMQRRLAAEYVVAAIERSSCIHGPEPRARERELGIVVPGPLEIRPEMFTAMRKPAGSTMHIGQTSTSSS